MTAFLWKLSAWLLLLNLGEIFTIFSYAMVASFLESLIILVMLLVASVLLPAQALRDDFLVRGTILSIGLFGSLAMFVGFHMRFGIESGNRLLIPPLIVLLLMALLLRFSAKFRSVRSVALWLSDRFVIFLFILLPLFLILSIYVALRNID